MPTEGNESHRKVDPFIEKMVKRIFERCREGPIVLRCDYDGSVPSQNSGRPLSYRFVFVRIRQCILWVTGRRYILEEEWEWVSRRVGEMDSLESEVREVNGD